MDKVIEMDEVLNFGLMIIIILLKVVLQVLNKVIYIINVVVHFCYYYLVYWSIIEKISNVVNCGLEIKNIILN